MASDNKTTLPMQIREYMNGQSFRFSDIRTTSNKTYLVSRKVQAGDATEEMLNEAAMRFSNQVATTLGSFPEAKFNILGQVVKPLEDGSTLLGVRIKVRNPNSQASAPVPIFDLDGNVLNQAELDSYSNRTLSVNASENTTTSTASMKRTRKNGEVISPVVAEEPTEELVPSF